MIGGSITSCPEGVTNPMPIVDQPWTRVRDPRPIPSPLTRQGLTALEVLDLAELIRGNLMPRSDSAGDRRAWEDLWGILKRDDELADRALDVLEDFQDATQYALRTGTLDEAATSRATRFLARCEEAWQRVDRVNDGALAWAGKAGEFPPAARRVIATLVGGITRHRGDTLRHSTPRRADERLWQVLRAVNLDPEDYS